MHALPIQIPEPQPPQPTALEAAIRAMTGRYPRVSSQITIEVQDVTVVPARILFSHARQRATLILSASLANGVESLELIELIAHQMSHVAQQLRRWRRRAHPGATMASEVAPRTPPSQWPAQLNALVPDTERELFFRTAPSCPSCSRPPSQMLWVGYGTPAQRWAELSGMSGWSAGCQSCDQWVVTYLTEQN